jgi:hypothetical protein
VGEENLHLKERQKEFENIQEKLEGYTEIMDGYKK